VKIQSKQLLKYSQQPTSKQELQIYRSKSGSLSVEVKKHQGGIRGALSGLARSIRHRGKQQLSKQETADILNCAATIQKDSKPSEKTDSITVAAKRLGKNRLFNDGLNGRYGLGREMR